MGYNNTQVPVTIALIAPEKYAMYDGICNNSSLKHNPTANTK